MRYFISLAAGLLMVQLTFAQQPPKVYEQNKTLTYYQLIKEYEKLAKQSKQAQLITYGKTDSGKPLHLMVISSDKVFDAKAIRKQNKRIVLINNGIHPGEPAGMEASLQLAAQLIDNKSEISKILDNTVICIIPAYNIGGMLNRSAFNRANQNGPEECGFRGNARNIDLNRDYMICQTENAQSFTEIFHDWQPDVFLETHTTDGSDHQQTLTLITTAHQDLPPMLGNFLDQQMNPALYQMMEENSEYLMCPYVMVWRKPPDEGFKQFLEPPRFSTGYTSLYNTISFMTENHIFKPFKSRVLSCLDFMHCLLEYTYENAETIGKLRAEANNFTKNQTDFVLDWKLDSSEYDEISFKGYEATYPPSKLTGEPLLYYDRDQPYTKKIPFYNHYTPNLTKKAPEYYIVPQAWKEAVKRLKWNTVELKRLAKDTSLVVDMYYIEDFETTDSPYNGHYMHSNTRVSSKTMPVDFYKGDYVVPVKGREKYYIMHALEPEAPDSYFNWNLFDEVLQSREYFSPFIFEEKAMVLLDTIPGLKEKLRGEIASHPEMENNTYLQMRFIYRHSPYFEDTYRRYPIGRIYDKRKLPMVKEKEWEKL